MHVAVISMFYYNDGEVVLVQIPLKRVHESPIDDILSIDDLDGVVVSLLLHTVLDGLLESSLMERTATFLLKDRATRRRRYDRHQQPQGTNAWSAAPRGSASIVCADQDRLMSVAYASFIAVTPLSTSLDP